MSWKWHYGDHPCHSQNLPQNLSKYYIASWFFSSLQLCNCQCILPAFLLAHCQHTASLPPGHTNEVAAKKNSTLTNLMSDYSWSHTRRIIINCRNLITYKTFCYIYKKQCYFFFSIYLSSFQSLAISNPLLFRRESLLPLTLKKESQHEVEQCMVNFPEENFASVFVPTL